MTPKPSRDEFATARDNSGATHPDCERVAPGGTRDERLAGFHTAYTFGRLGSFLAHGTLCDWLENAPTGEDWSVSAADYVLRVWGVEALAV